MISFRIDVDPLSRHIKIEALTKPTIAEEDLVVLLSQITTNLLVKTAQQRALIINPLAPIEGKGIIGK